MKSKGAKQFFSALIKIFWSKSKISRRCQKPNQCKTQIQKKDGSLKNIKILTPRKKKLTFSK